MLSLARILYYCKLFAYHLNSREAYLPLTHITDNLKHKSQPFSYEENQPAAFLDSYTLDSHKMIQKNLIYGNSFLTTRNQLALRGRLSQKVHFQASNLDILCYLSEGTQ